MHRRSAWRCAILASALQSTVMTQTENVRDHARPITTGKHGNMHASISGVPYNGSKDRDAPLGALIKRVYLFCLPRGKSFFRQSKDSSRRRHAAVTLRMICRGVPISCSRSAGRSHGSRAPFAQLLWRHFCHWGVQWSRPLTLTTKRP